MQLPAFQLAYYFPPIHSVGVRRNEAMARLLVGRGHRLTVITSEHTPVTTYDFPFDLIRVPVIDYRTRRGQTADFAPAARLKSSKFYGLFSKLNNSFPSNLVLGEGGLTYIIGAFRRLAPEIERAGGRGVLYSSFRPWADIQVGYLLKRRYPELIWWCDWRDTPFELRHRNYLHLPTQRAVVGRGLAVADLVTAVSAGVRDDLALAGHAQTQVVYNGASLAPSTIGVASANTPCARLVYTGSLYGPNRDPRPVLRAVAALGAEGATSTVPRVTYAGKDETLWEAYCKETGAKGFGESRGLVSPAEAQALQQNALANILLTWANPGQTGGLTMKAFEYLQAGRPIVRIHDGPPDAELDELLAMSVAPTFTQLADDHDLSRLRAFIAELVADPADYPPQAGWGLRDRLEAAYELHLIPCLPRA